MTDENADLPGRSGDRTTPADLVRTARRQFDFLQSGNLQTDDIDPTVGAIADNLAEAGAGFGALDMNGRKTDEEMGRALADVAKAAHLSAARTTYRRLEGLAKDETGCKLMPENLSTIGRSLAAAQVGMGALDTGSTAPKIREHIDDILSQCLPSAKNPRGTGPIRGS